MCHLDSAFSQLWDSAGEELRCCFQMIGPACDDHFETGDERDQPKESAAA
jgi:hypothetical protein